MTEPARIREEHWQTLVAQEECASGIMMFTARNEQGIMMRTFGDPKRVPVDFDGLTLIRVEI